MKKSLLALAVTGAFAGAAQAQSSVTVYGVYDGGYAYTNKEETAVNGSRTNNAVSGFAGGQQASSRIGFRGAEDLGKGLSAVFNLEVGITPGNGALTVDSAASTPVGQQSTHVRTSVVGISNKGFGTVTVGRQLTAMHTIIAGAVNTANNMAGDITYSDVTGTSQHTTALRIHSLATRMSNSVAYRSDSFSGLRLNLDYSADNVTGAVNPASPTNAALTGAQIGNMGAMLDYTYGPFRAMAGTHTVKSNTNVGTGTAGTVTKTNIQAVGAVYSAKGLVANATWAQNKTDNDSTGARISSVNAWKLGVSYAVTPQITPYVQYGQGVSKLTTAAPQNQDNDGYQVGATYALSKRSSLYAAYGNQTAKITQGTNTNLKTEIKELGIGLVHTF
jgi:predicted porin